MILRGKVYWIIVLICLCCALTGCKTTPEQTENQEEATLSDYTEEAIKWADSVVQTMTDRELAGQVLMPALYADSIELSRLKDYASSMNVGGVVFLKGDTISVRMLCDSLTVWSKIGAFVAMDAEWGLSMRLADAPDFPVNGNVDADVDDVLLYDYGQEVARESRLLGINVILGPVLDVVQTKGNIIGKRSFGDDTQRVANLGIAYARGLEDGNVLSVAKHFPGQGNAKGDSHHVLSVLSRNRAEIDSIDLYPFKEYVKNELSGIMIGHVAVPALDSVMHSSVLSVPIVKNLLRDTLGFEGLIFTDAMNMKGLGEEPQPIVKAIMAGANVVIAPVDTRQAIEEILEALNSGVLPRQVLVDRCKRILFYKYAIGLNDKDSDSDINLRETVSTPHSQALSRRLRGN
jgi:beta-glucosidase-like glycosyl hydrolase